MRETILFRLSALFLSLFLLSSYVFPGSLDPTFGRDGKTTVDFPGSSSPTYSSIGAYVFTQPSGRIVGIGHPNTSINGSVFAFARYTDITND